MKKTLILIGITLFIIIGLIIFNIIYVKNYHFELLGHEEINININDAWEDPLYIVDNNKEIDIKDNIDYNKEGNYEVKYTLRIGLFKKTLIRKINVVKENADLSLNIIGDNPYYLMNGNGYQEYGYESFDKYDGNMISKVDISNNIDNMTNGNYEVKYQVKNSNGIIKTVIRNVIVYSLKYESKLKNEDYTQNNEIILNINDPNYSYTILPDGNQTREREISYAITENNKYIFKIYDKNNASTKYAVDVNNIDNTPPSGTCKFTLNDNDGIINVEAADDIKLQGYEYNYGNTKTEIIDSNKFIVNTLDSKASVTIYDSVGNKTNINCKTIDKSTITKRSYTKEKYDNREYWLYVPSDTTTRKKAPLVIYLHGAGGAKDINAVNNHALPQNIKNGHNFPYYGAFPHFSKYNITETNKYIMNLIDELVKKHNIDPERIIISGGSNGSDPAYYIAANNKDKFSGMLIIAGHTTISNLSKLTYLKVWFHQGEKDAYRYIENYSKELNKLGGNAKITKYAGGHTAPNNAFLTKGVTEWILEKK